MDDDCDERDDSKRRTRNLSEKKRRDQFNLLVNELGAMITSNNRKMDKSTVLKSTISFLKNHNEVTERSRANDVNEDWKPAFLSNEEYTYLVLEALEGFLMVFSSNGKIYYVSESITSLVGHNPVDIVNRRLFDLIYEDDRTDLYNLLQKPGAAVEDNEIRFQCHVQRGTRDFRDEVIYELIQFSGNFRRNVDHTNSDDSSAYTSENDSEFIFVCTGCVHTPQLIRSVTLVDATRNEFTSRHSLEWKFLFLDHRAPPIIGYLPFEVLGTSGYDYYHFDDLDKVVKCHEELMQKGELTSCYYRFLTKGQQWIWLQTRYYITYHQWNSKPEFVVCTHRVVSYADLINLTKQEGTEEEPTDKGDAIPLEEPPDPVPASSPPYVSEPVAADAIGTYHSLSQMPSLLYVSAGSTAKVVTATATRTTGCVTATATGTTAATATATSVSGESCCSNKDKDGERKRHMHKMEDSGFSPQRNFGPQYLEQPHMGLPLPTMTGVAPGGLVSLPPHLLVTNDQGQMQWPWQEQLQRKHEQLQQMILRQQEELRQVKEQLLLTRLGMLQPLIDGQYGSRPRFPLQLIYEGGTPRVSGYPQQHPQQHPSNAHQGMPQ